MRVRHLFNTFDWDTAFPADISLNSIPGSQQVRIPDEKIDEIRSATDIVDLIGGYVKLRKRGKNFLGLCPFHTEKTPSFNVSPDRQMYHCFGCGAGGNVFTFLMEFEKVSFVEAVRTLAKAAGIELPPPGSRGQDGEATEQDRAYELFRLAGQYYHRNLTATREGKIALEYLHHRGIENPIITEFGLGYAHNSWDAFLHHAGEHGFNPEFLQKFGMARRREDGSYYDYFRGRLLFPVFTAAGRPVGFGARKIREDDPLGKYINSPETPVYNKSRILYGLAQSKNRIRDEDSAILVEGYLDLLTMYQAGILNLIASSGTALTVDQVLLLRRYSKNLTIVFDADSAGAKAALRGVEVALEQDMDVRIVRLPEGTDPDAFLRDRGVDEFRKLLGGSLSFVDYVREEKRAQLSTPEGRAGVVHSLVETLSRMPDTLKRDFYVKHIAEKFGLREAIVHAEIGKVLHGKPLARSPLPGSPREDSSGVPARRQAAPGPARKVPVEESVLLSAVLRGGPDVARFVFAHITPQDFTHSVAGTLAVHIFAGLEEGDPIDASSLIDRADDPAERDFISEIVLTKYELSRGYAGGEAAAGPGDPLRIARDTLVVMKRKSLQARKMENQKKMKEAAAGGGDVLQFLRQNTLLDEEIQKLEKDGLGDRLPSPT